MTEQRMMGAKWSKKETEIMIDMHRKCIPAKKIAETLKRPYSSVQTKISKMVVEGQLQRRKIRYEPSGAVKEIPEGYITFEMYADFTNKKISTCFNLPYEEIDGQYFLSEELIK